MPSSAPSEPVSVAPCRQTFLAVGGMMCGSCAAAVEAVLAREPGVREVGVNFAADAAYIEWDPAQTTLEQLLYKVNRLGYRVEPLESAGEPRRLEVFQRRLQIKLAIAVFFGMWSMLAALVLYLSPSGALPLQGRWALALASGICALPVVAYSGFSFYIAGWRTLRARVPGMDTLISLGVGGAVTLSVVQLWLGHDRVYFDTAVMLITFQLVARLVDHRVRRDAAGAAQALLHAAPERVQRLDADGGFSMIPSAMVQRGDHVLVSPGGSLGVDGVVVEGQSSLDCSLLSGESAPVPARVGDKVYAGSRNGEGALLIQVATAGGQRRVDDLARSVRAQLVHKSGLQKLADRVASRLLPVVALAAVVAAALAAADGMGVEGILARLLAVVVITCPCALSLAVPVVTLLVEAQARSRGLLFRDPAAIEQAATVRHVVLDKTGTLTSGLPVVRALLPAPGYTPQQLLALAAAATFDSKHPLASGLALAGGQLQAPPGEREVRAGSGVIWQSEQGIVLAGRASWLREQGVTVPEQDGGTEVCVARNGEFIGRVRFTEQLRPEAISLVRALQADSLQVHVLSGDTASACVAIGERLNLDPARVHHGQSPEDKLEFIRGLQRDAAVAFIGDGLNDGPALAAAHLGVAAGEATASARSAAALLLPEGIQGVLPALRLARRARRVMLQNLGWALAYNLLALPAAMLGWVHPAIAAAAMGLSSICVLINTLRLTSRRRTPNREPGHPARAVTSAGQSAWESS